MLGILIVGLSPINICLSLLINLSRMSWNNPVNSGSSMGGYGEGNYFSESGFGGGGGDNYGNSDSQGQRNCYNCGETGHNKMDCPMPRQFSGACNGCGKEGHMAKDCPEAGPQVCRRCKKAGHMARDCDLPVMCPRCGEGHFVADCSMPMVCRLCNEEGHLAKECPTAPPRVCSNCQEPGHEAADCKAPRKITRDDVPTEAPDKALELLRAAAAAKDLDDVKAAFLMYVKACPEVTYLEMEQMFRHENIGVYLIGVERTDLSVTLTNMDLQGNLDRKYTVTFRFNNKPSRPREKAMWPANDEENLKRLAEGGEPVARGIPLCMNCRELGHISRNCPTERIENTDQATVACQNCGSDGHRLRDCECTRTAMDYTALFLTDTCQARLLASTNLLAATAARAATMQRSVSISCRRQLQSFWKLTGHMSQARSPVLQMASSVASVVRVGHPLPSFPHPTLSNI